MQAISHIFVVGWARTGTTSMAAALRLLGWPTLGQHLALTGPLLRGDLRQAEPLVRGPLACHDWPWPLAAEALAARFPAARFILTTRDAQRWLASYRALVNGEGRLQRWRMARVRRLIYGGDPLRMSNDALLARVARHEAGIRALFAATPQRLLEIDVTCGTGWPALCAFLGCAEPAVPFPHLNRTTMGHN